MGGEGKSKRLRGDQSQDSISIADEVAVLKEELSKEQEEVRGTMQLYETLKKDHVTLKKEYKDTETELWRVQGIMQELRGAFIKKGDYFGVFPNRGWGGPLNPKTFVI